MVDNPIPTVALVLIYLACVMVIGPFYMRDRKPFKLKNTLIYYNAFQVILSGYMFYEVRILCLPARVGYPRASADVGNVIRQ